MTRPGAGSLSIGALQRALRTITEWLAAEIGRQAGTMPDWTELEWRLAPAVASMHGVGALLAMQWRWPGPSDWLEFLRRQHAAVLARERRIEQLTGCLEEHSRRHGFVLVLLKGAALRELGVYRAGERPMADLDLLVRPADAEAVARLLASLGYREIGATWKHRAFEPEGPGWRTQLGEHADSPIKIDLHVKVAERLPLKEHDFSDVIWPRDGAPGIHGYPSLAALMLHVLAHAAGAMVARCARLIQLSDIARIAERMTPQDWAQLAGCGGRERRLWWISAPLYLTSRYFPAAARAELPASILADCPWLLRLASRRRSLTDLSYSRVLLDPVPGIVWARSPLEMARYVVSRIYPSAEQRTQLATLARTGPWSVEPRWYAQSQLRRILQWMARRPARTETMQPVRAALAGTRYENRPA